LISSGISGIDLVILILSIQHGSLVMLQMFNVKVALVDVSVDHGGSCDDEYVVGDNDVL
jgi:hypothetical protein